ncbi:hypothetical protein C8R21_102144 [Nitrosospira multiformis]|uniref:Uncharacterized protein n=1 Tax=Nitrosospira multiformis TaxID=1231 RepID=A0A2T5IH57_9PROT|nr:hypothetical protein [Nitrosospira multiformis]PTQ83141.1 hypothetical protein C8R21_102144 [Nitrosospira multiformis]
MADIKNISKFFTENNLTGKVKVSENTNEYLHFEGKIGVDREKIIQFFEENKITGQIYSPYLDGGRLSFKDGKLLNELGCLSPIPH